MARSVGVAVGIGALFFAGWNCLACSSSDPHPSPLSSAGTGATAATAGSSGGNGLDLGSSGKGNGNGPDLSDACAAKISTAQPFPLDIYIMLDVSGSMLDLTAAQATKWDAVKLALESFLTDDASAGIGVGLQYFPLLKPNAPATCTSNAQCGDSAGPCFLKLCFDSIPDGLYPCETVADCPGTSGLRRCLPIAQCTNALEYFCPNTGDACETDTPGQNLGTCQAVTESFCLNATSCDVAQYTAPASAIATLPGAASGLMASIDAKMPGGDTPTGPALKGAIEQARSWATLHPDHRVVTVLATDGLPTECTPDTINAVAALATAGVNNTPSINTFVIGVFGPDDVANGAPGNLDRIALQGGTQKAFIVDTQKDVTTQFQAALDTIRGARLACEFQIPEPTTGGTLNYGQVNVALSNGTQKSVVYYVKSAADCDPGSGGWYYDVEPSAGTPGRIIACPASCDAFQAAPSGASVGIALGCDTVVK
jgi:hypothetical protein